MQQVQKGMVKRFKRTQDYVDICYMVDHIKDINVRLSVLAELGYQIGVDINRSDMKPKDVKIGKKGDIRVQVSRKLKGVNMVKTVILPKMVNKLCTK